MDPKYLRIRGARTHNLKNINADLPRNKLIVFTGLSGSGKSSLAFDTLYAEGQRRYVESLSTYARQFLGQMDKPDVDVLEGLSPTVAIEQKTTSKNPRSTVGTVTEIYDYLRLLFARVGRAHCPQCGTPIEAQSPEEMVAALLTRPAGEKIVLLAPLVTRRKGAFEQLFEKLRADGYVRVRIDGVARLLSEPITLEKNQLHTIEVVVDRLVIKPSIRRRLEESVAAVLRLSESTMVVVFPDSGAEVLFSQAAACHACGISIAELSPQLFSFNNPQGACAECGGLGVKHSLDPALIVPDPRLSLEQGAIEPLNRGKLAFLVNHWRADLAAHGECNFTTPFEHLPAISKKVILYGSEQNNAIKRQQKKEKTSPSATFAGIMARLDRVFRTTPSPTIREEVSTFMTEQICPACHGARLKPEALAVRIASWSIVELTKLSIAQLITELDKFQFSNNKALIAAPIVKELRDRLTFLHNVGLGYLSLDRKAGTLSGGEAQRIRLASQIGSQLAGVMYILDEPSIGLHQRDNNKLIKTLEDLRDLGNTVIVVEHDRETILVADHVLDIGPGAGVHGGNILYSGAVSGLLTCANSVTGGYVSGRLKIETPAQRRAIQLDSAAALTVHNVTVNNLKNISVKFPLGTMTCVTGVSGSGKSSLVIESLFKEACKALLGKKMSDSITITGLEHIDKVIDIDQSPIGRTPRSNPATYIGVLTPIRELFARLPEARARGYMPNRFSFNLKGGRCDNCEGDGVNRIAMHFLPDVYVTCDACKGRRYNFETLEIAYRGKNIAEILAMTIEEALDFFKNIPQLKNRLQVMHEIGLGYLTLGQSAVTLSGGEAQRVKLARELSKRAIGRTLYILDEPTTGLHPADVAVLLKVLSLLVDNGNTVIIIEHNLDVIKYADYIIDIGPEGGEKGGRIVAQGRPEEIARCAESYTGYFLKEALSG